MVQMLLKVEYDVKAWDMRPENRWILFKREIFYLGYGGLANLGETLKGKWKLVFNIYLPIF